ncbi:MAG: HAMP domain-containing histidine kinase [Polyangiaceae bacterium]|nr:HAMP domain-containing histidine kinase [Polyangiaceae bacterium]
MPNPPWQRRKHPDRAALFRDGPAAFMRARLHRRIFAWLGISILFMAFVLFAISAFFDRLTGSGYRREMDRANTFIAHQFTKVWDDPKARNALAEDIARDFDVRVEMRDTLGASIEPFSDFCKKPVFSAQINREGTQAGEVRLCFDPRRSAPKWGGFTLFLACVILWAASGRIAIRLSRPLGELARVAHDLGSGKLDSRVDLGCYEHGEVGVVAESMNEMAARIQKQVADQRELLAAVSHELRTPLARIRLLTEIARDGGEPGHAFDEIDREVVEIDQLVGELLASSRIDFSALSTKPVSAVETAHRAVSRAGLDSEKVLTVYSESDEVLIPADPTLLARALANLIENATRHGGGVVRVAVRCSANDVTFEVEDNGPGLIPGEEERIFEAFYQGGNGDVPKKGIGLGLALVKRIAVAHGGRAFAENRSEGGARIGIVIPRELPLS